MTNNLYAEVGNSSCLGRLRRILSAERRSYDLSGQRNGGKKSGEAAAGGSISKQSAPSGAPTPVGTLKVVFVSGRRLFCFNCLAASILMLLVVISSIEVNDAGQLRTFVDSWAAVASGQFGQTPFGHSEEDWPQQETKLGPFKKLRELVSGPQQEAAFSSGPMGQIVTAKRFPILNPLKQPGLSLFDPKALFGLITGNHQHWNPNTVGMKLKNVVVQHSLLKGNNKHELQNFAPAEASTNQWAQHYAFGPMASPNPQHQRPFVHQPNQAQVHFMGQLNGANHFPVVHGQAHRVPAGGQDFDVVSVPQVAKFVGPNGPPGQLTQAEKYKGEYYVPAIVVSDSDLGPIEQHFNAEMVRQFSNQTVPNIDWSFLEQATRLANYSMPVENHDQLMAMVKAGDAMRQHQGAYLARDLSILQPAGDGADAQVAQAQLAPLDGLEGGRHMQALHLSAQPLGFALQHIVPIGPHQLHAPPQQMGLPHHGPAHNAHQGSNMAALPSLIHRLKQRPHYAIDLGFIRKGRKKPGFAKQVSQAFHQLNGARKQLHRPEIPQAPMMQRGRPMQAQSRPNLAHSRLPAHPMHQMESNNQEIGQVTLLHLPMRHPNSDPRQRPQMSPADHFGMPQRQPIPVEQYVPESFFTEELKVTQEVRPLHEQTPRMVAPNHQGPISTPLAAAAPSPMVAAQGPPRQARPVAYVKPAQGQGDNSELATASALYEIDPPKLMPEQDLKALWRQHLKSNQAGCISAMAEQQRALEREPVTGEQIREQIQPTTNHSANINKSDSSQQIQTVATTIDQQAPDEQVAQLAQVGTSITVTNEADSAAQPRDNQTATTAFGPVKMEKIPNVLPATSEQLVSASNLDQEHDNSWFGSQDQELSAQMPGEQSDEDVDGPQQQQGKTEALIDDQQLAAHATLSPPMMQEGQQQQGSTSGSELSNVDDSQVSSTTQTNVAGVDSVASQASGEQERETGAQQTELVAAVSNGVGEVLRSPVDFCAGQEPGLYPDVEQLCHIYYQCSPTGDQVFRCANGTLFDQRFKGCNWWFRVSCGGQVLNPNPESSSELVVSSLVSPAPSANATSASTEEPSLATSTTIEPGSATTSSGHLAGSTSANETALKNPAVGNSAPMIDSTTSRPKAADGDEEESSGGELAKVGASGLILAAAVNADGVERFNGVSSEPIKTRRLIQSRFGPNVKRQNIGGTKMTGVASGQKPRFFAHLVEPAREELDPLQMEETTSRPVIMLPNKNQSILSTSSNSITSPSRSTQTDSKPTKLEHRFGTRIMKPDKNA